MGAYEQGIIRQALRSGQPIPDRILNAPSLRLGLGMYLEAFFDLDGERHIGLGMGRIPYSAVLSYAYFNELDGDQTECLLYFIKTMDTAHLKRLDDGRKKN